MKEVKAGSRFLITVLLIGSIIAISGMTSVASASYPYVAPTMSLVQPKGSTISGTYEFEATIYGTSGFSINSATFGIDGTNYGGSQYQTPTFNHITDTTKYYFGVSFNAGNLNNGGPYSWTATFITNGSTLSKSSTFSVDNTISISIVSPTSGSTVEGTTAFDVKATAPSPDTVSTVTMTLDSQSFNLVLQGNNQYSITLNLQEFTPNTYTVDYAATGSGGITGSTSAPITIIGVAPTNWNVIYTNPNGNFAETVIPQMSAMYQYEAYFPLATGTLSLYPSSTTSTITITPPGRVGNLQYMYFPASLTPYYSYTSTSATSWGATTNKLTISAGTTYQNNMGITSLNASGLNSLAADLTGSITSTSNWTVGGFFKLNTNSATNHAFFGQSPGDYFEEVPQTNGTFQVEIVLQGSTAFDLIASPYLSFHQWYSIFLVVSGNTSLLSSYALYIDGEAVSLSGSNLQTSAGYFGTTVTPAGVSEDIMGIASFKTGLSATDVQDVAFPYPWQLNSPVNPPFFTVTQDYYSITITNGTTPWSSSVIIPLAELSRATTATVTIAFPSPLGQQSFVNYNTLVDYTPYFALSSFQMQPFTNQFTLPLGSSFNVSVTDYFGIEVGDLRNTVITQTAVSYSIPLDISTLQFTFINSATQTVSLTHNNITENGILGSTTVANNTEYNYTASVFANNVENTYNGSIYVAGVLATAYIVVAPPPAAVTVSVFAYNLSQAGYISSSSPISGQPSVYLYINGVRTEIGSTYNTQLYAQLNITVKDMLGQILYNEPYTVLATTNSIEANISTPSWILGITNNEQVNSTSSPLATETVVVTNQTDPAHTGTFHNTIGDTLELYLKNGSYTVNLSDNLTTQFSMDLSQSQSYHLFGQEVLTQQQFDQMINRILQNVSQMNDFKVIPISVATVGFPGETFNDTFQVAFGNGTLLTGPQLQAVLLNSSYSLTNTTSGVAVTASMQVIGNKISATYSLVTQGSYTLSWRSIAYISGSLHGLTYSGSVSVTASEKVGMSLTISQIQPFQANNSAVVTISVLYANNTAMNASDTHLALKYTNVSIEYQGNFYALAHPYYIAPGEIGVKLNLSKPSTDYVLQATVTPFTLDGVPGVHAFAKESFTVTAFNPTQGTPFNIVGFFTSLPMDIFYFLLALLGLYAFLKPRIRAKHKREEKAIDNVTEVMEGNIALKVVNGIPLTEAENNMWTYAIEKKVRDRLITVATAGKQRTFRAALRLRRKATK